MSALAAETPARPPHLAQTARTSRRRVDPVLGGAIAAALVARIFFWAYTDRRFEDGLTSITHAVNAANGLGLTHHPGEGHVHGFTSALSVLVPLAGELIHHGWGFLAIRLASLAAAVATVYFADRLARRLGLGTWARVFLLGYLALDYLQIFFGMAGMETQMAVAVLLWGASMIDERRVALAGLALGLSLLARPDFLLWVAPAVAWLFVRRPRDTAERRHALRTVAIAAAVVLPWIVFTTLYYGSPVPHTIKAKALVYEHSPWGLSLNDFWDWLKLHFEDTKRSLTGALEPMDEIYFANMKTFALVPGVVLLLALIGAWARRRAATLAPLLGFALLFVAYLLYTDPPAYFRWYLPPFLAVVAVLVACGIDWLTRRARVGGAVVSVALLTVFAIQLPVFFPLDRVIQHKIEDRVREQVGLYLHRVVAPGQTVMAEPAGYLGYYGHVKLLDFPGLTSPTVTNAVAKLPPADRHMGELIPVLKPDWLVLRPLEMLAFSLHYAQVAKQYHFVRRFSVSEQSSRLDEFGVAPLNIDRDFSVYRRDGVRPLRAG